MNHSLSQPYEPNFMSIVPRWQLLWTKTPLKESSNVIQLFHACSANFILGTMKGSNLFLQKRRECSGRSKYWAWEIQAPFCDEPWRRRIKHFLQVPNFSLSGSQIEDGDVPGPRQVPLGPSLFCSLFCRAAWLNMIYVPLSHSPGFIAQLASGNSENIKVCSQNIKAFVFKVHCW